MRKRRKMDELGRVYAQDGWPRFAHFTACELIVGGTLQRLRVEGGAAAVRDAIAGTRLNVIGWTPGDAQRERHCDGCPRVHRSTNLDCSATLQRDESYAQTPDALYWMETKRPVPGEWRVIDVQRRRKSTLTKETYERTR